MKTIAVFCGANQPENENIAEATIKLADTLAEHNLSLVYGGGNVGLMGLIADTVLARDGTVTGVITPAAAIHEMTHTGLSQLITMPDLTARINKMAELSDAFIALPGGYGTLAEIFIALSLNQLELCRKPCGLINTDGYYDQLLQQLEGMVKAGLLRPENHAMLDSASTPDTLIRQWLAAD